MILHEHNQLFCEKTKTTFPHMDRLLPLLGNRFIWHFSAIL